MSRAVGWVIVMAHKLGSLKTPSVKLPRERASAPFHAVSIRCSDTSCAAARNLRSECFLAAEAPLLPLADCDRGSRCTCNYRHQNDRRRGPRRSEETGAPPLRPHAYEQRRQDEGRRVEDSDLQEPYSDPLDDTYYDFIAKKYQ